MFNASGQDQAWIISNKYICLVQIKIFYNY